jgi:hypothetical protein
MQNELPTTLFAFFLSHFAFGGLVMFSKFFLSERDLEAIQGALLRNPLLASLLMISPVDAFRYLNLVPKFFDALLPAPAEDVDLVRELLRALEAGKTALEHPQTVEQAVGQPAPPPGPVSPEPEAPAPEAAPPDVALSVSKAALQRAVQLYADGNFKDQEFVFPAQRWLDVKAKGVSIDLDLAAEQARIIARLWGAFAFRAASLERLPGRLTFPIEIELRARVIADEANNLLLSVSEGELSIVNPPLPGRLANDLVKKIVADMPGIPLVQVPTRFEIPGDPPAELALRLSHIGIDPGGLRLELRI